VSAAKWTVPSGYCILDDIVREYGRDHAQTKLISGQWPAFQIDLYHGDLYPIPVTTWCVARGRYWLEKGAREFSDRSVPLDHPALRLQPRLGGQRYAVVVQISEQPPARMNNLRGQPLAKELIDTVYPQGEWRQRLTEGRAALVLAEIIYRRTCVCRSETVTLPAAELVEVGIDRSQKSRALAKLEAAGLIRIEQARTGQSSRVTLLWR